MRLQYGVTPNAPMQMQTEWPKSMPEPIYVLANCKFAAPLQWSLTIFWRESSLADDWFVDMKTILEQDGIRLLNHRFINDKTSQFAISSVPQISPLAIVQRLKGRLQNYLKHQRPKAFQRNFCVRSIGTVTRKTAERYVETQLNHHRMGDVRVQSSLSEYQHTDDNIDLAKMQYTSHGTYWYNLHLVTVFADRWCEVRNDYLRSLYSMTLRTGRKWSFRISRVGIFPDHIHIVLGASFDQSPAQIALSFLNNFAFVYDMKPMYQYGAFIGTVGEYTNKAF